MTKAKEAIGSFLICSLVLAGCSSNQSTSSTSPQSAPQTEASSETSLPTSEWPKSYEAKLDGSGPLYESVEQANNFISANLDTKLGMAKRTIQFLPHLEEGESVKVTQQSESAPYVQVETADGKKGWVPYTLLAQPDKSIQQIAKDSVVGPAFEDSVKTHGAPQAIPAGKSFESDGLRYTIVKTQRKALIGTEDSESLWAKANPGYEFEIVTYKAQNITKEPQSLSNFQALVDSTGQIYPTHLNATMAFWESQHFQEPVEIAPGKTISCSQAFYVPTNLSTSKLFYTVPDGPNMDHFKYKLALGVK